MAKHERELLTQVLHHLHEIDRRKLFSSFKYQSLFEFAVKYLGYSEDQACRRISAMRLMQQIPEVESQLETGELNLSHVSVLSTYFNQEAKSRGAPLSIEKKKEVINLIAGTSIRKAQQIIRLQSSNPACLSVDQNQDGTPAGVPSLMSISRSRHIPASSRREVYKRANSKCEHCGSKFALQIDHVMPFAMGGRSDLENLRLLCRNCNQRVAIKHFGVDEMSLHLVRR